MAKLSIIITALNEQEELTPTLESIKATAGDKPEIIVVDDFSTIPVTANGSNIKIVRNQVRQGVGPSRHIGAEAATGDYILLTDAHMRFDDGWYEAAMERIVGREKTMHCGACLGLDKNCMDIKKPRGVYTGATMLIHDKKTNEIFEGKWIPDKKDQDDYELGCVMGASYFLPRKFFFDIGGLKALKMWGSDEPYLSMKTWMAGGEIRMMKSCRIGHKFRDVAPYSTWVPNLLYNKIRSIMTLFDEVTAAFLISKFPQNGDLVAALKMIAQDNFIIEEERKYYKLIFEHDARWFCEKFNITYPNE